MKRILPLTLLLFGICASAQTSYTILGGTGCGPAMPVFACSFTIEQVNPLGEYAYGTISVDLTSNLDNQGRGVEFGNFEGPTGSNLLVGTYQSDGKMYRVYTSTAQVCSNGQCSQQTTVLSAYIKGFYADQTPYTALITLHFAYVAAFQRGGTYIWQRWLAKGAGAITVE